jgi:Fic-DOC domain mobile mystery protein B
MTLFEPVEGATPIEDSSDLIPTHILTRAELNEWEAANILKATRAHMSRGKSPVITVEWLKKVHKAMFDETWQWAGLLKKRNYNMGSDWHQVQDELKLLVDDINYWEKKGGSLGLLERSVRIHHRLVNIHPFVNGNGRHARLVADIFLFTHGQKLPEWPEARLIEETDIRKRYIQALQEADKGNYKPLEQFTSGLINYTS